MLIDNVRKGDNIWGTRNKKGEKKIFLWEEGMGQGGNK